MNPCNKRTLFHTGKYGSSSWKFPIRSVKYRYILRDGNTRTPAVSLPRNIPSIILFTARWLEEMFPVSHSRAIIAPFGRNLTASIGPGRSPTIFKRCSTSHPKSDSLCIHAVLIGFTPLPVRIGFIVKVPLPGGQSTASIASSISSNSGLMYLLCLSPSTATRSTVRLICIHRLLNSRRQLCQGQIECCCDRKKCIDGRLSLISLKQRDIAAIEPGSVSQRFLR